MKMKTLFWLASLALVGCGPGPKSSYGFRLPDGDVAAGQAAFVALSCDTCHTVEGTELPARPEGREIEMHLGGKVRRVSSYGELVTAIIVPAHDIASSYGERSTVPEGSSPMADFNKAMTVQQLIDLVAFLQSTYTEHLREDYDPYFP